MELWIHNKNKNIDKMLLECYISEFSKNRECK